MSLIKAQKVDGGTGASLGGKAERAGTVLSGEEKAYGFLINVYKYLKGVCIAGRASLFSVVPLDRTRSSGRSLFRLNIRKCDFTVRMTKHWQLPREVVECPLLEMFRCCLDRQGPAAGSWWPCWNRGVGLDVLQKSLPTSVIL